jgi:hypothetical protein
MAVILQPQPAIIETMGAPEFFVSGTVLWAEPDVYHITCYSERIVGDRIERIEVCRVHMARSNYVESLTRAYGRMKNGGHH